MLVWFYNGYMFRADDYILWWGAFMDVDSWAQVAGACLWMLQSINATISISNTNNNMY